MMSLTSAGPHRRGPRARQSAAGPPPPGPRTRPSRRAPAPPGRARPGPRRPRSAPPPHPPRPPAVLGRGPERSQPVGAEEVAGHEQGARAAAADHVQRLGTGEPRADRDQRGARAERAQRGQHPITVIGGPDGHPVCRGHARRDERGGDRGHPLVQLAVAEPGPVRPRQRVSQPRVGQPRPAQGRPAQGRPVRARRRTPERRSPRRPGSSAPRTLLASKCLVGLAYAPGAVAGQTFDPKWRPGCGSRRRTRSSALTCASG